MIKKFLTPSGLIIAISLLVKIAFFQKEDKVYIDLTKLYNEFSMKEALEKDLAQLQTTRKEVLDSLKLELQLVSEQVQHIVDEQEKEKVYQKLTYLNASFVRKKQLFEKDNGDLLQNFSDKIWKQLNQYVSDYGKQQGYTFIFGGDGNGSLMYVDKELEVTEDVIYYVNQRYEGNS